MFESTIILPFGKIQSVEKKLEILYDKYSKYFEVTHGLCCHLFSVKRVVSGSFQIQNEIIEKLFFFLSYNDLCGINKSVFAFEFDH